MNEMETRNNFVNSIIETLDAATLVVQQELDYIEKADMPPILELEKKSYCQGKLHIIHALRNAMLPVSMKEGED